MTPSSLPSRPEEMLEAIADELEKACDDLIEKTQLHANNISSIYRAVCACIDAHEAGDDALAWSTLRKIMEATKTLELELLANITEMRQL